MASKAKGAKGLSGATAFTYDANGNLVFLDRGKNQKTKERSGAVFEYDLEGHIIGRGDKAGALVGSAAGADFFAGYEIDPDAATIAAGTQLSLHSFIVLAEGGMSDATQITNYSVKRIGLDGMPSGSVQCHVVQEGVWSGGRSW